MFAALTAVVAVAGSRRRRRDQDRMRQWAAANGWNFTTRPDVDWGRWLSGGNRRGIDYAFSAVLHGRPVTVAEYSVTDASDGTTTNTHYHVVTVAVLHRSQRDIEVTPRGRASRLTRNLLGTADTATGNATFDRDFRVRTEPTGLVHRFWPSLITAHLAGQIPPSWRVQGNELFCHRLGRLRMEETAVHATAVMFLADLLDGNAAAERFKDER